MKIVINKCYGGFSISRECAEFMAARGNKKAKTELKESNKSWGGFGYTTKSSTGYSRTDPDLILAVETLDHASGSCAKLKVVKIPDGIEYEIDDYDGIESIHEKHRRWL